MTDELLAAYRHDAHKLTGERHDTASPEFQGVEVNRAVPLGADEDAAALSRPRASHSQTVPTHATNRRLSLLTGDIAGEDAEAAQVHESKITDLLTVDDAEAAHERWLTTDVAAAYNESAYDPYTSLKYHTLLVAALLDNYRSGRSFSDLQLVVDHPDEVVAFRTVFTGDQFALRIDGSRAKKSSTGLGDAPARSWASTWSRLPEHRLDVSDRYGRVLNANLRRIRAWSTALQYVEDFEGWRSGR